LVWSESDKSFKNQLNNQLIPTRLTEYDLDGRMSAVALPAVADPLNANAVTRPRYQYGYSLSGQQSLIVDPYGHETRLAFDAFGRQVSRTLPLGFGVDGKLGTTDDSAAEAFSEYEQYDSRGRKSLHISFEGVHEQNIYDDKTGRLTEIRYYPNASAYASGTSSEVRKFSFDDRGRTNKIEHFVGGVSVRIETMEFDDDGRLYETMNPEGKVRYTYDVHGRMTRKEWSSTAFMPTGVQAFENTVNYAYDELGRLKTVVQRDRGGVTLGTSDVTAYRYTLDGLLDTTRYHNGLIHDNDYDSLGRLKTLTHWVDLNADGKQQSSENRATFDYTVRADGKRTKVVESIKDGTTPVVSNEFIWEYDALDRLISETLTDQYDLDWIYDLAGNRRTQTKSLPNETGGYAPSEVATYAYDANDRLTTETKTGDSQSTATYSYLKTQQNGKQSTESSVTTTQSFAYDLQGLLASVETTKSDGSNPFKTVYRYDSTGIRVGSSQHERVSLEPEVWNLQSDTQYLTDTQNHTGYSQVLQETSYEGGVATKKVIYTIGHDQISQSTLAREAGTETWSLESDAWFGTDGHGSVRVLYDLAAAIAKDLANAARLQVYTFDAYGNLQGWPTSSLTPNTLPLTTYLYSGESFDFNIGQQYLRARLYDATTGRFNRLDPFFGNSSDPQSFHKYGYVHGDPISNIDPTGEFSLGNVMVSIGIGMGNMALSLTSILLTSTAYTFAFGTVVNAGWDIRNRLLKGSTFGVGGYDATSKLSQMRVDIVRYWDSLPLAKRKQVIGELHDVRFGWVAWDIQEMLNDKKSDWTRGVDTEARETLTFRGNVYPVADVNYVLWGLLNGLAYRDGINRMETERGPSGTFVIAYRGVAGGLWASKDALEDLMNANGLRQNFDTNYGRVAWADFGWQWANDPNAIEPVTERLPLATANNQAWGGSLNWSAGRNPRWFGGQTR
jgi:RHS repeat-associated protein